MSDWSATEAIGFGWEKLKADPVGLTLPVLVVGFIQGLPNSVLGGVAGALEGEEQMALAGAVRFVSWLVGLLLSAWLTGGTMKLFLKAGRGQPYQLSDVFSGGPYFVQMLLTLFIIQFVTGLGFMLCIVPGVILAIGLQFAVPLVVDKDLDAVEALKESWRITTGLKLDLFTFGLLAFGVALLGMLVCCIGVLPASAMIAVAQVFIYLRIQDEEPSVVDPDAPAQF